MNCAQIIPYHENLCEKLGSFIKAIDEYCIRSVIFIEILIQCGDIRVYFDRERKVCGFDWKCKRCHKIIIVEQLERYYLMKVILYHLKINKIYGWHIRPDKHPTFSRPDANEIMEYLNGIIAEYCIPFRYSVNMEICALEIEIRLSYIDPEIKSELINKIRNYDTCVGSCYICGKKFILNKNDEKICAMRHYINHLSQDKNMTGHYINHLSQDKNTILLTCSAERR